MKISIPWRPILLIGTLLLMAAVLLLATRSRFVGFQRGVVYASWRRGEYSSPQSDTTLATLIKPLGVNSIALVVTCYQRTAGTPEIECNTEAQTPTDADVAHAIESAHRLGLGVMLKPHIDLSDDPGHWRGDISFGDDEAAWAAWFGNYTAFIAHYAELAQATGADYFVVGTELAGTTHRAGDWRSVVRAVRAAYGGPITYAANHSGEELAIEWWDALDAIGVDAYYPLTERDDPTVAELTAAWQPIVARLGQLSQEWNRPVILTEVGYQSRDGTNRTPWRVEDGARLDLQEQADCYQAVFEAFGRREWWRGVYWWAWTAYPDQGGPNDGDFTANGKPAAEVLRRKYLAEGS